MATKRNKDTKAKKNSMTVSELYDDAASDCAVEPLQALLSKPDGGTILKTVVTTPPSLAAGFSLSVLDKQIGVLVDDTSNSTARYGTFTVTGAERSKNITVCFHQISGHCAGAKGLVIGFQGYGGFDKEACKGTQDRWRAAVEADLYDNLRYPFVNEDKGYYNKESLEWLKALLDPEGPFKTLLPLMAENTPEEVQARRAFIFPDVSLIPARLTWCFAIASRLGYANARSLWRYLHLLDKGLDRRTSMLIAGGFAHEIKNGRVTGKIIKNYTGGFLGVDVTAYAGRFLSSNPIIDQPYGKSDVGTYGSSKVFQSGKIDMKNLTFDDWEAVIAYTQARAIEQSEELRKAA